MITWKYPTPSCFKDGQAVGINTTHGQYWRGWEGRGFEPESSAKVWFAIYKPYLGAPVTIIEKASASAMYECCTEHDQEMLGRTA